MNREFRDVPRCFVLMMNDENIPPLKAHHHSHLLRWMCSRPRFFQCMLAVGLVVFVLILLKALLTMLLFDKDFVQRNQNEIVTILSVVWIVLCNY